MEYTNVPGTVSVVQTKRNEGSWRGEESTTSNNLLPLPSCVAVGIRRLGLEKRQEEMRLRSVRSMTRSGSLRSAEKKKNRLRIKAEFETADFRRGKKSEKPWKRSEK